MTHKLEKLADAISLSYTAEFVPLSKSRNRPEIGGPTSRRGLSLNWRITLSKGQMKLSTDYMQGIAHAPDYKQSGMTIAMWERFCFIAEQGKVPRPNAEWSALGLAFGARPLLAPKLADVLYCLVSDAEALDYPTFEEWAGSFGFNTDSREGERAYRACLETGLKLRAMLGDETLSKLREAAQDY